MAIKCKKCGKFIKIKDRPRDKESKICWCCQAYPDEEKNKKEEKQEECADLWN